MATFTKEQLRDVQYDPHAVLNQLIEDIDNTGNTLVDPTNPFVLSLEATSVTTTNALAEMTDTYRRVYPSLAQSTEHLYAHMTNDQELNMFASPSDLKVQMFLNYDDIISYGEKISDGTYKTSIPELTVINIGDLDFTVLNRIDITINSNGPFVDQIPSTIISDDIDIGIVNKGIIESQISTDVDGNDWVTFSIRVKQLSVTNLTSTIIRDTQFNESTTIEDQYFMLQAKLTNNNGVIPLSITHSTQIVDADKLTMVVKNDDDKLSLSIPNIYSFNNNVDGKLDITIFTTKGKVLKSLTSINDNDFTVVFPELTNTLAEASIKSVTVKAFTNSVVDGGTNQRPFKDIRKKVIYNASGAITIPVTDVHLQEINRLRGFTIAKALDTITNRLYVVSKNPNDSIIDSSIPVSIDLFNGTITCLPEDYLNSDDVDIYPDSMIVKSSAILTVNNGKLEIMTKDKKDEFLSLDRLAQREIINNENVLYTPFYYYVNTESETLNSKVFDLDSPSITNKQIISKNIKSSINVNISNYGIKKTSTGYLIGLDLIGNTEFDGLTAGSVKARASIIGDTPIYLDTTFDSVNNRLLITMDTLLDFDNNNLITLLSGTSLLSTKKISLDLSMDIYLYRDVPDNTNSNTYITGSSIGLDTPIDIITKENLILRLGSELEYLWNKVKGSYTGRKFLKHTKNKLLRYDKIVYQVDENNCPILIGNGDCKNKDFIVLHNKGDVVKDGEGKDIYEYKAGDVIIGVDGQPMIDKLGGIIRYIDVLLLDYSFKVAVDKDYASRIDFTYKRINRWVLEDLAEINNVTLDNTVILYRPNKNLGYISTDSGEVLANNIQPVITLYVHKDRQSSLPDTQILFNTIGKILHKYTEKRVVVLNDIRNAIVSEFGGNIEGVKIENITSDGREIIDISATSSRFHIKTLLNKANEIHYDMNLNIEIIN